MDILKLASITIKVENIKIASMENRKKVKIESKENEISIESSKSIKIIIIWNQFFKVANKTKLAPNNMKKIKMSNWV